ncbi:hypothetical protein GL218_00121 [Daldinia childiae]|uniref:uncharacterized protein n=1 Tax=Daldinia childiae TaxID=326645 RepID=UPI00144664FB|nr:uncharacterized protein GL218_00121 [Daldinia childiae]KAF3071021.1 hypothetical protein GL218_00121 [Daldinia childiae]
MAIKSEVDEQPREGTPKHVVRPILLRPQPESISWKGMMSQTDDSRGSAEEQRNTTEDVKNEDGEWEVISPREVNNCSSDYYGNYVKERPVEQGEWLAVSKVTVPQSTAEWFKHSSSSSSATTKGKRTVIATSTGCVKGWVNGMQKRLHPKKNKNKKKNKKHSASSEQSIGDEAYVKIATDGESSDTDTGPGPDARLLQRRPDTPRPRELRPVPRADGRWVGGFRDAARPRESSCRGFSLPMTE